MDEGRQYVEREADLFEAGAYPDRKLTVTEADIERLAKQTEPAPIHVEHSGGSLKLGEVTGFQAAGRWLKGIVRLYPEADALLGRNGLRTLSVAVTRALDRVTEVSVTGRPRVAGARMFNDGGAGSECVEFALGETPKGGDNMPDDGKPAVTAEQFAQQAEQFAALKAEFEAEKAARVAAEAQAQQALAQAAQVAFAMRVTSATAQVDAAIEGRKLPPAAKDAAVALMLADGTVKFGEGEAKSVPELFSAVLAALPEQFGKPLSGQAGVQGGSKPSLTAEQEAFYAKHFPGLSAEDIAKFGEMGE